MVFDNALATRGHAKSTPTAGAGTRVNVPVWYVAGIYDQPHVAMKCASVSIALPLACPSWPLCLFLFQWSHMPNSIAIGIGQLHLFGFQGDGP